MGSESEKKDESVGGTGSTGSAPALCNAGADNRALYESVRRKVKESPLIYDGFYDDIARVDFNPIIIEEYEKLSEEERLPLIARAEELGLTDILYGALSDSAFVPQRLEGGPREK